jgi:hypothetical protein
MALKYDRRSANSYGKKWGKYRISLDGYVYLENGKMVLYFGEGMYEKYRCMQKDKLDAVIEKEMKKRGLRP